MAGALDVQGDTEGASLLDLKMTKVRALLLSTVPWWEVMEQMEPDCSPRCTVVNQEGMQVEI